MNLLYYGDNLDILRQHVKDESVRPDLPSTRRSTPTRLRPEILRRRKAARAEAQVTAFRGFVALAHPAEQRVAELLGLPRPRCVRARSSALRRFLNQDDMMAYLTMMANQLVELRRVLAEPASLLHFDPTGGRLPPNHSGYCLRCAKFSHRNHLKTRHGSQRYKARAKATWPDSRSDLVLHKRRCVDVESRLHNPTTRVIWMNSTDTLI